MTNKEPIELKKRNEKFTEIEQEGRRILRALKESTAEQRKVLT